MKYFDWNAEKNTRLKLERGVCFEDVQTAIQEGRVLDNVDHPHKARYPNQKVLIVNMDNYAYAVPYAEDDEKIFFKTIYPSRKLTKRYIIGDRK